MSTRARADQELANLLLARLERLEAAQARNRETLERLNCQLDAALGVAPRPSLTLVEQEERDDA